MARELKKAKAEQMLRDFEPSPEVQKHVEEERNRDDDYETFE